MKKLLYISFLLPICLFAQTYTQYVEQDRPLNLNEGWNMIGFTCNEPIDVIDAFLPIFDKVIVAKDNNGAVYLPEFDFNGIGDFEYGYGYQLKLTESISDFQFCPAIMPLPLFYPCDCCGDLYNLIEECDDFCAIADIICDLEGCTSEWADNYDIMATIDDGSCYKYGCINSTAINFDSEATVDDGSCLFTGCMNPDADNYNPQANVNAYCQFLGCTYTEADNFDPQANEDDGSCQFTNCFYPPDSIFVIWLQVNVSEVMSGDCLDIIAAADHNGSFNIEQTLISNLDGLQYFTNLDTLHIHLNPNLYDLPVLSWFTNLSMLSLYRNINLFSLPEFSELNNLKSLNIEDNWALTSVPDLSELTNLVYLQIQSNNSLTVLPDLSGLISLNWLNIQSNHELTILPNLSELINLNYLNIHGNSALTTLPSLSGLTNLSELEISSNDALISIPDLTALDNLSVLDIFSNEALVCIGGYPEQITIHQSWPSVCEEVYGCTDATAFNYNPEANTDDGSCEEVVEGCMDAEAFNYNPEANTDDGSCEAIVEGCTDASAFNYSELANTDDGSCIPMFDFEYDCDCCCNPFCVGPCLHIDCSLVSCSDEYGCMDSLACNYNPEANMADGSCEYSEQGYDCGGNIFFEVGDYAEGGIVFYVDETGQHGLVAAMEDLTEGAIDDPYGWGVNGYEWGCYMEYVDGADGTTIGTGYQNTMDIVNHGCSTENGGITAAHAALNTEIYGYIDWYLPSKDELIVMYNTIGNGGPLGNIGDFLQSHDYWSSSESSIMGAWGILSSSGNTNSYLKYAPYKVRVIRSF